MQLLRHGVITDDNLRKGIRVWNEPGVQKVQVQEGSSALEDLCKRCRNKKKCQKQEKLQRKLKENFRIKISWTDHYVINSKHI